MRYLFYLVLFFFISMPFLANANQALLQRQDAQQFINVMVKEHGFNRRQLSALLKEAVFQQSIIDSMNRPYEKKTWDVYQRLFLTPERVKKGLVFWELNKDTLAQAEKKYGVPAHIIVAILGVETMYGTHQGHYRVLDALTTLAFYYPKRATFFTKELKEYLLLCREQGVSPTTYLGSYAGAMGKPQFMPSSYRFYAVDFTGNGRRDLIHEDKDVIGSVANYFHKHGWALNEAVVQMATVKKGYDKRIPTNERQAKLTLSRLAKAGIIPATARALQQSRVGVIELATEKGPQYWLAYPNFYVITRYNTSPQYALAVYLLAEQLRSQWNNAHATATRAYA